MGLFSEDELEQAKIKPSVDQICNSCGLYKKASSPKMEPYGKFKKRIMVLGEAPGPEEDETGKPWQGRAGRLLRGAMEDLGYDLFNDCVCVNAVACFPNTNGKVKTPTTNEIGHCRDVKVIPAIEEYKPKVILTLGNSAMTSVLAHRWTDNLFGIRRWRGCNIPDRDFKSWLGITYHPSFIMRVNNSLVEKVWRGDLQTILDSYNKPLPKPIKYKMKLVYGGNVGDKIYEFCKGVDLIAFDYETTGIRPQAPGHRIVCVSVARSENEVIVCMLPSNPNHKVLDGLKAILKDKKIGKMAHNLKFEENWTRTWLGVPVNNWKFDSMVGAHLLDSRSHHAGLKFQTYVNFGVLGYNKKLEGCLVAKDNNSHNKVEEFIATKSGKMELMKYCGLDSIYQYNLAIKQMKELGRI